MITKRSLCIGLATCWVTTNRRAALSEESRCLAWWLTLLLAARRAGTVWEWVRRRNMEWDRQSLWGEVDGRWDLSHRKSHLCVMFSQASAVSDDVHPPACSRWHLLRESRKTSFLVSLLGGYYWLLEGSARKTTYLYRKLSHLLWMSRETETGSIWLEFPRLLLKRYTSQRTPLILAHSASSALQLYCVDQLAFEESLLLAAQHRSTSFLNS